MKRRLSLLCMTVTIMLTCPIITFAAPDASQVVPLVQDNFFTWIFSILASIFTSIFSLFLGDSLGTTALLFS